MNEINNTTIKIIKNKPFCIFKIENFFSNEFYEELKFSFPIINDYQNLINNNHLKFSINSENHDHYEKYLKNNSSFLKLKNIIEKKDFFYLFKNKLGNVFLESRKSDLVSFLKILRPYKYNSIPKKKFIDIFFCNVRSKIQYSYILNEGKIVPHTDGVSKLLSLMIYFPENENDEINNGTTFWNSKIKNFGNKHINNQKDLDLFLKQSNKIYETPFEKNVVYGFIKNSNSWHSVNTINLYPEYIRKSININFFI